jgi:UTP--glucose-1-phosphate uridylyltransferase
LNGPILNKITKAVFPVAGMGTRFLPATKASPKEMLPIVDKPLIQYAVEEAISAGVTELIFVTGRSKRAIEDHFDKSYELESELEARGKTQMLQLLRSILPGHVTCVYIRQAEALGLGHAVLCAKQVVGNEPFAVILADDLIDGNPSTLSQMGERFEQTGHSILGVEPVEPGETASYGIIDADESSGPLVRIKGIVEKPDPAEAPSNLAVVGRYILTPAIFDCLENVQPGKGGEIQLTDGIAALMAREPVLAYRYHGIRYDCGSKLGYMKANVEYALRHPEIGSEFNEYLRNRLPGVAT